MAVRADLFIGAPSQLLSVANLIDTNATRGNERSKVDSMLWKSESVGFAKIAGPSAHPNRSVSLVAASNVRGEREKFVTCLKPARRIYCCRSPGAHEEMLDNVSFGTAIPEPHTSLFAFLGLVGSIGVLRLRKKK